MRTVFFGSSEFSLPSLARMLEDHDVVAVCSQPDKPAGRGLKLTPTPVSEAARKAGCTLLTPRRLDRAFVEEIAALRPELLACASYGKILPARLLTIEGMTALNLHPSLLPAYRGATPIQSVLREGRDRTGVTVFWMSEGMDEGNIALQQAVEIESSDTYGSLHDKLANAGAELLGEAAQRLSAGRLPRTPQREEDATYTKPLSKEDLQLRFDVPAHEVVNQIRSLSPKPAARMTFNGKRLKVLEADVAVDSHRPSNAHPTPGTLLGLDLSGPIIAAAPGAICLRSVIPEGKPQMTGAEFVHRTTKDS